MLPGHGVTCDGLRAHLRLQYLIPTVDALVVTANIVLFCCVRRKALNSMIRVV